MIANHFIPQEYNTSPVANKNIRAYEPTQNAIVLDRSSQCLMNPADTSYISRHEDSALIRTNPNNSMNMTNLDIEDLEEQRIQNQNSARFSNVSPIISPSRKATMKLSLGPSLIIESGKFDRRDLANMGPIIAESPQIADPKGFSSEMAHQETGSRHIDPYLISRDKLKKYNQKSSHLDGSDLQFSSMTGKLWERSESLKKGQGEDTDKSEGLKSFKNLRRQPTGNIGQINKSIQEENAASEENEEAKEEEQKVDAAKPVRVETNQNNEIKRPPSAIGPRPGTGSSNSGQKTCKICLESTEDETVGKFVAPCKCTGSVQNIHDICLKTWIKSRGIQPKKARCELCKTRYKMKFKFKMVFTPRHAIKEGVVSFVSGICLLAMVIGLTVLIVSLLTSNNFNKETGDQTKKDDGTPDDSPKSGTSVKVFVTMVCGIFIVVLSLLLCFAWREAFFISKITNWEIQNFDPKKRNSHTESKDSLPKPSQDDGDSSSESSEARRDIPSSHPSFSHPVFTPRSQDRRASSNNGEGEAVSNIGELAIQNGETISHNGELEVKKEDEIERQDNMYTRKDIRVRRQDSAAIDFESKNSMRTSYDLRLGHGTLEAEDSEVMRFRSYSINKQSVGTRKMKTEEAEKYDSQVSKSLVLQLGNTYWKGTWGQLENDAIQGDTKIAGERGPEEKMSDKLRKILAAQPGIPTREQDMDREGEQRAVEQNSRIKTQPDQNYTRENIITLKDESESKAYSRFHPMERTFKQSLKGENSDLEGEANNGMI